jgi:NAD(P)-dependent dehydrogenase (short-subunit alcohol dehydrogenase family)
MTDTARRVALVTGGSTGIGLAAARALAQTGTCVVLHGLDESEARSAAAHIEAETGCRVVGVGGPIQSRQTSVDAVATALATFDRLDVLVTSAGIQRYGDVVSTSQETWDEVIAVNLTGVYHAAHVALPHIRMSPAGAVVVVASVQGTQTQPQVAAYTAGKGALHALTRAMAVDEASYGVRVNSVSPGSVDTPMLRASARLFGGDSPEGEQSIIDLWGASHPLGRVARPSEIGAVIAFLAGEQASFMTGADVRVDGGLLSLIGAPLPQTR